MQDRMRTGLSTLAGFAFSITSPWRNLRGNALTVFCFHDIGDSPSRFVSQYGLGISTATFRRQIAWVRKHYDIVHPRDVTAGANLPRNACLISFDDGFAGSFDNGIAWLEQQRIPSLMFLNMRSIIEGRPLLSAIALYLGEHSPPFRAFAAARGLTAPYHLTLSPTTLAAFELEHGPVDMAPILAYQGKLGDIPTVAKWGESDLVGYGNHLYDHWNSVVLTDAEFFEQYYRNETALASVGRSTGMFAFPNGISGPCFSRKHVELLMQATAIRAFSADGRINTDASAFLLDRIALGESDGTPGRLSLRVNRHWLRSSILRNPARSSKSEPATRRR